MKQTTRKRVILASGLGVLGVAAPFTNDARRRRVRRDNSRNTEDAVVIPAPTMDAPASDGLQTAVIAGGCFWGVQGVFQHVDGVTSAV